MERLYKENKLASNIEIIPLGQAHWEPLSKELGGFDTARKQLEPSGSNNETPEKEE